MRKLHRKKSQEEMSNCANEMSGVGLRPPYLLETSNIDYETVGNSITKCFVKFISFYFSLLQTTLRDDLHWKRNSQEA